MKRSLLFLCALMLALSPLMTLPVSAADYFVESSSGGSGYNVLVTGTPSDSVFTQSATYTFEVRFTDGFTLYQTSPLNNQTEKFRVNASFSVGDQSISVGGLTVTKRTTGSSGSKNATWYAGDTFSVVISEVGNRTEGTVLSRRVMNSSGNSISRITRNTVVRFAITVQDPVASTLAPGKTPVVMITGGSFIEDNPNDYPIKVSASSKASGNEFVIEMDRMRYNGSGNVLAFTIIYYEDAKTTRAMDFSLEWSQCVEASSDPDENYTEDGEKLDPITPYIIVESFDFGGTSVTGGEDFTLQLVLRNTSSQYTLQNVVMNVNPTGVYNLTSSSNTYYLRNLFAGASTVRTISLKADLNSATNSSETPMANAVEIKFTYQYVANDARMSGNSSETITIPVTFPDRLEINSGDIPTNMWVDDSYSIYIPVINKGRTSAYNVEAVITGDLDAPGRSMYVGNINNGEEGGVEFDISFSEPGLKTCQVLITYEDANMNTLTKTYVFAVEVEDYGWGGGWDPDPGDFGPEIPMEPEPELKVPSQVWVAGIGACGLSCYLTIAKAKARRDEFLDEAL